MKNLTTKYPEHFIIKKIDGYYMGKGEIATLLNKHTGLALSNENNQLTVFSSSFELIRTTLEKNNVNFIVVDENDIIYMSKNNSIKPSHNEVIQADESIDSVEVEEQTKSIDFVKENLDNLEPENLANIESEFNQLLNYISELEKGVIPLTGEILNEYLLNDIRFSKTLNYAKEGIKAKVRRERRKTDPRRINAGTKWTDLEDEQLKKEVHKGLSIEEISKIHGRSKLAIVLRIDRLNIEED